MLSLQNALAYNKNITKGKVFMFFDLELNNYTIALGITILAVATTTIMLIVLSYLFLFLVARNLRKDSAAKHQPTNPDLYATMLKGVLFKLTDLNLNAIDKVVQKQYVNDRVTIRITTKNFFINGRPIDTAVNINSEFLLEDLAKISDSKEVTSYWVESVPYWDEALNKFKQWLPKKPIKNLNQTIAITDHVNCLEFIVTSVLTNDNVSICCSNETYWNQPDKDVIALPNSPHTLRIKRWSHI